MSSITIKPLRGTTPETTPNPANNAAGTTNPATATNDNNKPFVVVGNPKEKPGDFEGFIVNSNHTDFAAMADQMSIACTTTQIVSYISEIFKPFFYDYDGCFIEYNENEIIGNQNGCLRTFLRFTFAKPADGEDRNKAIESCIEEIMNQIEDPVRAAFAAIGRQNGSKNFVKSDNIKMTREAEKGLFLFVPDSVKVKGPDGVKVCQVINRSKDKDGNVRSTVNYSAIARIEFANSSYDATKKVPVLIVEIDINKVFATIFNACAYDPEWKTLKNWHYNHKVVERLDGPNEYLVRVIASNNAKLRDRLPVRKIDPTQSAWRV